MSKKIGDFLDARLGSILTGVTINLVAGAVVLLLAKICLPEQITNWRIWLSLLISVLAVGTVVWLGVSQRMELRAMQAAQRAVDELADELRQRAADANRSRDQIETQIQGLGRRIDEVAGQAAALEQARESDAGAIRGMLKERVEAISVRVDELGATMTSSLNALEEAKLHEGAAARKLMLEQVAALGKRIDELKAAAGAAGGTNPAVEALKQGVGRLTQDLAELRRTVEGLRAAKAPQPAAPEQPKIIPAKPPEKPTQPPAQA